MPTFEIREKQLPVIKGFHTHIEFCNLSGVLCFFAWSLVTKDQEEKYLGDETVAVFKIKWK